ncbi:pyridoxal-phosphate dependent enzyme [[Ruminococcus] gnavus]|uniref:1-aminocyclopropane-1-carboxylate deaminase/D-cysteine desulfhydrase n=1 Tax=Mediterraneibacter gnavus TaxID=33038 RepID=UPI00210E7950|nr:pyridoxal-phosphate dependent enzyme [Mediterraneibacter gnavus]MCQ4701351.1 pyridoxal-phosphate dependent enzyme [Mediterraneibacter gnavus]
MIDEFKSPIQKSKINYEDNQLYFLREDLIPFSFGGNKVRIAEKFIVDMKKQGKDCIVAYGNSRSNLCRVLSNMCCAGNIPCFVISPFDEDGTSVITNNKRMVNLFGAEIIECEKENVTDTVQKTLNMCVDKGYAPYYIYGNEYGTGNEAIPVEAYVKVIKHIKEYEEQWKKEFDYIFHASSTGMTQAGLISGSLIHKMTNKIIGISTARVKEQEIDVLNKYINEYMKSLGKEAKNYYEKIFFEDSWICGGYGKYNNSILTVIKEVLKKDGINLDPTYTGKAFWGMLEYLKRENIRKKNILFIHTGGAPLFFDCLEQL